MSEQSPFDAPLSVPPGAPVGLAPASPFAPPPRADHPAMTLTELSFAPAATEAPAVEEPVAPPPGLNSNVLPSDVGVSRSGSRGGRRLPLIGLVVIALLAAVGVVFGPGLLEGDEAETAAQVVNRPPVTKPVNPGALPNGFKAVSVTRKSHGTLGRGYNIGAPKSWTRRTVKKESGPVHTDLVLGDKVQGVSFKSARVPAGDGVTLDAMAKAGRTGGAKTAKGKAVGSIRKTKVAGHDARSFDIVAGGTRMRMVVFVDGKTLYTVAGATTSKAFAKFVSTYELVLDTWKFAGK